MGKATFDEVARAVLHSSRWDGDLTSALDSLRLPDPDDAPELYATWENKGQAGSLTSGKPKYMWYSPETGQTRVQGSEPGTGRRGQGPQGETEGGVGGKEDEKSGGGKQAQQAKPAQKPWSDADDAGEQWKQMRAPIAQKATEALKKINKADINEGLVREMATLINGLTLDEARGMAKELGVPSKQDKAPRGRIAKAIVDHVVKSHGMEGDPKLKAPDLAKEKKAADAATAKGREILESFSSGRMKPEVAREAFANSVTIAALDSLRNENPQLVDSIMKGGAPVAAAAAPAAAPQPQQPAAPAPAPQPVAAPPQVQPAAQAQPVPAAQEPVQEQPVAAEAPQEVTPPSTPKEAGSDADPTFKARRVLLQERFGRVLNASNLPQETKQKYMVASMNVLKRMSPKMLERMSAGSERGSHRFFASSKELTDAVREKMKEVGMDDSELGDGLVGGLYIGEVSDDGSAKGGSLWLDGGGGELAGDMGGAMDAETTYAHEFTHAIDGPDRELSSSPEWDAAWRSELSGVGKLTEYAGQDPQEGFAEFGRLLLSGKYDAAAVKSAFPKSFDYWVKQGLADDVQVQPGDQPTKVELGEVFSEKRPISGEGNDHADISITQNVSQPTSTSSPTTTNVEVEQGSDSGQKGTTNGQQTPEAAKAEAVPAAPAAAPTIATGGTPDWMKSQQASEKSPATATPTAKPQLKNLTESMKIPDHIKDEIRRSRKIADNVGATELIEEMTAQRMTADVATSELVNRGTFKGMTRNEIKDVVRGTRATLGIPSMEDATDFEAWLKGRNTQVVPTTKADVTSGSAAATTPPSKLPDWMEKPAALPTIATSGNPYRPPVNVAEVASPNPSAPATADMGKELLKRAGQDGKVNATAEEIQEWYDAISAKHGGDLAISSILPKLRNGEAVPQSIKDALARKKMGQAQAETPKAGAAEPAAAPAKTAKEKVAKPKSAPSNLRESAKGLLEEAGKVAPGSDRQAFVDKVTQAEEAMGDLPKNAMKEIAADFGINTRKKTNLDVAREVASKIISRHDEAAKGATAASAPTVDPVEPSSAPETIASPQNSAMSEEEKKADRTRRADDLIASSARDGTSQQLWDKVAKQLGLKAEILSKLPPEAQKNGVSDYLESLENAERKPSEFPVDDLGGRLSAASNMAKKLPPNSSGETPRVRMTGDMAADLRDLGGVDTYYLDDLYQEMNKTGLFKSNNEVLRKLHGSFRQAQDAADGGVARLAKDIAKSFDGDIALIKSAAAALDKLGHKELADFYRDAVGVAESAKDYALKNYAYDYDTYKPNGAAQPVEAQKSADSPATAPPGESTFESELAPADDKKVPIKAYPVPQNSAYSDEEQKKARMRQADDLITMKVEDGTIFQLWDKVAQQSGTTKAAIAALPFDEQRDAVYRYLEAKEAGKKVTKTDPPQVVKPPAQAPKAASPVAPAKAAAQTAAPKAAPAPKVAAKPKAATPAPAPAAAPKRGTAKADTAKFDAAAEEQKIVADASDIYDAAKQSGRLNVVWQDVAAKTGRTVEELKAIQGDEGASIEAIRQSLGGKPKPVAQPKKVAAETAKAEKTPKKRGELEDLLSAASLPVDPLDRAKVTRKDLKMAGDILQGFIDDGKEEDLWARVGADSGISFAAVKSLPFKQKVAMIADHMNQNEVTLPTGKPKKSGAIAEQDKLDREDAEVMVEQIKRGRVKPDADWPNVLNRVADGLGMPPDSFKGNETKDQVAAAVEKHLNQAAPAAAPQPVTADKRQSPSEIMTEGRTPSERFLTLFIQANESMGSGVTPKDADEWRAAAKTLQSQLQGMDEAELHYLASNNGVSAQRRGMDKAAVAAQLADKILGAAGIQNTPQLVAKPVAAPQPQAAQGGRKLPQNVNFKAGQQSDHQDVAEAGRAMFGRDVSPDLFASAVNGFDGSTINFSSSKSPEGGLTVSVLEDDYGGSKFGYEAIRQFTKDRRGKVTVENVSFRMPKDARGKGEGAKVFADQVASLREMGVDTIKTTASGNLRSAVEGVMNGYVTWPKMGYDGTIPIQTRKKLPQSIRDALGGKKNVQALLAVPGGEEAWELYGGPFAGKFDTREGSPSVKKLEEYMAGRASRPPRAERQVGQNPNIEERIAQRQAELKAKMEEKVRGGQATAGSQPAKKGFMQSKVDNLTEMASRMAESKQPRAALERAVAALEMGNIRKTELDEFIEQNGLPKARSKDEAIKTIESHILGRYEMMIGGPG